MNDFKSKTALTKYKSFFFDFDGVITDSLNVKTQAFGELFKGYGKDIVRKVIDYHRENGGISRYDKFRYYYERLLNKKINKKIINRLDNKFSSLVVKRVVEAPFIKGALAFTKRLNNDRKKCFIISATPQSEIRRIARLKKIDKLYREIVGSPERKPKNLKYLLEKYNINPRYALYFGDCLSDYESAKLNKVRFVGIVNKKSRELRGIKSITKIKDFSQFIGIRL